MHIANPAVIDPPHKQIVMLIKERSAKLPQHLKPIASSIQVPKTVGDRPEIFRPLLLDIRRIIKTRAFWTGSARRETAPKLPPRRASSPVSTGRNRAENGSMRRSGNRRMMRVYSTGSLHPRAASLSTSKLMGMTARINRRRQSPIETQFFVEEMVPLAQGRIVEKRKSDRLLHLIDEDPRSKRHVKYESLCVRLSMAASGRNPLPALPTRVPPVSPQRQRPFFNASPHFQNTLFPSSWVAQTGCHPENIQQKSSRTPIPERKRNAVSFSKLGKATFRSERSETTARRREK